MEKKKFGKKCKDGWGVFTARSFLFFYEIFIFPFLFICFCFVLFCFVLQLVG